MKARDLRPGMAFVFLTDDYGPGFMDFILSVTRDEHKHVTAMLLTTRHESPSCIDNISWELDEEIFCPEKEDEHDLSNWVRIA